MAKTTQTPLIEKTPGICGGNARIRGSRIPVWTLVSFRIQGASAQELLLNYPRLTPEDLEAAWAYYASNQVEIDRIINDEND